MNDVAPNVAIPVDVNPVPTNLDAANAAATNSTQTAAIPHATIGVLAASAIDKVKVRQWL